MGNGVIKMGNTLEPTLDPGTCVVCGGLDCNYNCQRHDIIATAPGLYKVLQRCAREKPWEKQRGEAHHPPGWFDDPPLKHDWSFGERGR